MGRVKRPSSRKGPPTVSRTPAIQNSDSGVAVAPLGGIPIGEAKSFIVPACMKMDAGRMRSTLSSPGGPLAHFVTTLGAVLGGFPPAGRFARRLALRDAPVY